MHGSSAEPGRSNTATPARDICTDFSTLHPVPQPDLVVILAVSVAVVVIVLEEEVLVAAVAGEEHGSGSEAGQAVLEAVPAGKGALLSPSLSSLPGVVSRRAGGLLKGTHVEAGNVGLGSAVGGSQ
jgi:hypothetical protein